MDSSEMALEKERRKMKFHQTQTEKNEYLGEYKERVIVALKKEQLIGDGVYDEILEKLEDENTHLLKMAREIPLKHLKPYIKEAEKLGVGYQLIDGLQYTGDIGLVIVSKTALDFEVINPVLRDIDYEFEKVGLPNFYSKYKGQRLCKKCRKKVAEKLPKYLDEFKKLTFIDRLLGEKCPACDEIEGEEY